MNSQVASFIDKDNNHIEMGLHVFFGCYHNLFRLMRKCGVLQNLLLKVPTVGPLHADWTLGPNPMIWCGDSSCMLIDLSGYIRWYGVVTHPT
jgi:hypothetical protein